MFISLVESVMLYGAEAWTLGTHHENKSLATEMAARKSGMEKITNLKIREITSIQHIIEVIEER